MPSKLILKLAAALLAVSGLSGCGVIANWLPSFSSNHNLEFVEEMPESISVAWRDAQGQVWLVPKRGYLIEGIRSNGSQLVPWSAHGSYLLVRAGFRNLEVKADGRWSKLVLPKEKN
ncbi:hypothetical protein [Giesbergeria anulus]|uniref:Lipoprotein n=1 Tax=Giesbergeria anulus TaxID=180197 RepID=A0A1H9NDI6_9BURK|nr:hypothetical protein [Giesbergeria anulus]SER33921.1 hypothetical protein SAMN02982919_02175 [Giesbergeria anulus]